MSTYLQHFGIKGQRWGVSKSLGRYGAQSVAMIAGGYSPDKYR